MRKDRHVADIGDFRIWKTRHGNFSIWDKSDFNNWGERSDIWDEETARLWAQWATTFKTGRTFQTFEKWRAGAWQG